MPDRDGVRGGAQLVHEPAARLAGDEAPARDRDAAVEARRDLVGDKRPPLRRPRPARPRSASAPRTSRPARPRRLAARSTSTPPAASGFGSRDADDDARDPVARGSARCTAASSPGARTARASRRASRRARARRRGRARRPRRGGRPPRSPPPRRPLRPGRRPHRPSAWGRRPGCVSGEPERARELTRALRTARRISAHLLEPSVDSRQLIARRDLRAQQTPPRRSARRRPRRRPLASPIRARFRQGGRAGRACARNPPLSVREACRGRRRPDQAGPAGTSRSDRSTGGRLALSVPSPARGDPERRFACRPLGERNAATAAPLHQLAARPHAPRGAANPLSPLRQLSRKPPSSTQLRAGAAGSPPVQMQDVRRRRSSADAVVLVRRSAPSAPPDARRRDPEPRDEEARRAVAVGRRQQELGPARMGEHAATPARAARAASPDGVDDRLVLVGVQRADRVDDRPARRAFARRRPRAARAGARGAGVPRQRRSGRRPSTPSPEQGASTSARSNPLSASSRTSALTTWTFDAPSRRTFSASSRARPGWSSTAVTSPRSIVALPPGAAQASSTRSPSREPTTSAASCEPRLCGQMPPLARARRRRAGSTR